MGVPPVILILDWDFPFQYSNIPIFQYSNIPIFQSILGYLHGHGKLHGHGTFVVGVPGIKRNRQRSGRAESPLGPGDRHHQPCNFTLKMLHLQDEQINYAEFMKLMKS